MVNINDCECCDCDSKAVKEQIKERALSSINKIYTTQDRTYYPDGTGMVTIPLTTQEQLDTIDNVQSDLDEMDSKLTAFGVQLDGAEQRIEINTRDISTNAELIAGNTTEIQRVAGSISNVVDMVDTANKKITLNTSSIATNTANIVTLDGRLTTAEGAISKTAAKDTEQDQSIATLQALTNNITGNLVSGVTMKDGTQNGSVIVEITKEAGGKVVSPVYPWGAVNTFQLLQGSQAGYVKGKLILSDGTEIESNEFQVLELVESDVYVTSITLTPYPETGKLGGTIGYSNGNTQEINVIDVPTAPGVTSNIEDLLTRMGVAESDIAEIKSDVTAVTERVAAVETRNTEQDGEIASLEAEHATMNGNIAALDVRVTAIEETPGVGQFTNTSRGTILGSTVDGTVSANADGTGSVNGWDKKASTTVTDELATGVSNAISQAQGSYNAVSVDGSTLTLTKGNGEADSVTISSSSSNSGIDWSTDDFESITSGDDIDNSKLVVGKSLIKFYPESDFAVLGIYIGAQTSTNYHKYHFACFGCPSASLSAPKDCYLIIGISTGTTISSYTTAVTRASITSLSSLNISIKY